MSYCQPPVFISFLPLEVLSKIFSEALSSSIRFTLYHPLTSSTSSPWTLSLVCRQWKAIVYSVPSFWSSLTIDFVPVSQVCSRRGLTSDGVEELTTALIRAVHSSLLRSQDHTLQICIVADNDPTAVQFIPEVLLLCLEHSGRWKGAFMNFWCDLLDWRYPNLLEVMERDASGNKRSFPRLQNIYLKGPGAVSTPASISSTSWLCIFRDSPRLSSVWFRGDPHLFPELGELFKWSNITEFSTVISSVELFSRCNKMLCAMPRLTVFKLTFASYGDQPNIVENRDTSFHPDAHLLELRDFWVCPDQGEAFDLSSVFRIFPRAPRLSRFALQPANFVSVTDSFLPEFANFIHRSQRIITYLQINNIPAHQTLALFRLLPHLESLVAERVHFDEELTIQLATTPDARHLQPGVAPVLLPRLRSVGAELVVKQGLEHYVCNTFESRRLYPAVEGGPTLDRVYINILLH